MHLFFPRMPACRPKNFRRQHQACSTREPGKVPRDIVLDPQQLIRVRYHGMSKVATACPPAIIQCNCHHLVLKPSGQVLAYSMPGRRHQLAEKEPAEVAPNIAHTGISRSAAMNAVICLCPLCCLRTLTLDSAVMALYMASTWHVRLCCKLDCCISTRQGAFACVLGLSTGMGTE